MPLKLVSIKRCGHWAILAAGVASAESDLSSELSLRYLLSWDTAGWTPPPPLTCALNVTHCSLHVSFVLAATRDTRGKATTRPQGVIPVTKAHGILPWVQTASSVASHTSTPPSSHAAILQSLSVPAREEQKLQAFTYHNPGGIRFILSLKWRRRQGFEEIFESQSRIKFMCDTGYFRL